MRQAHVASPRARRHRCRKAPTKYEAVPASCKLSTLSSELLSACSAAARSPPPPVPAAAKRAAKKTTSANLSADPALWVKGAAVAVHCPPDEPVPFWLCRIDTWPGDAAETLVTWLEPTKGNGYALGGKDPVETTSIICTVREAGAWKTKGFTLTPSEIKAVMVAIDNESDDEPESASDEEEAAVTEPEAEDAEEEDLSQCRMVHLDGLPGSGKTFTTSQLAKARGYSVIELDEITQRSGKCFGFKQRIRGVKALETAFHREITERVVEAQRAGATTVLLSGVSTVMSDWGEVSIMPPALRMSKIWIDIAPVSALDYPGELGHSVERLLQMGVSRAHVAEVAESARRAVLRDLRDTAPEEWAETAEDWGDESSFYLHMADDHPDTQLSADDYQSLCFCFSSDPWKAAAKVVPKLAEWTALTLDDMTGRGEEQEEQYHTARGQAEGDGYRTVHWTKVTEAVVKICEEPVPQPASPVATQHPPASPVATEAAAAPMESSPIVPTAAAAAKKKTTFACPTPSPSTLPPTKKKKKKRTPFKPKFEGTAPDVMDGGFCLFMDKTGRTYSNGETARTKREEAAAKAEARSRAEAERLEKEKLMEAAAAAEAEKAAAEAEAQAEALAEAVEAAVVDAEAQAAAAEADAAEAARLEAEAFDAACSEGAAAAEAAEDVRLQSVDTAVAE